MANKKSLISRLKKINITKRQKFVASVIILSSGLFFSEHFLRKSGVFISFFLALLTEILVFATNYKDIKANFSLSLFVLPFFYSLSFGLFYFLVPARFLTRVIITSLYATGLYSLFLCLNIFTVASIRTIALLASARTTSFIITILSYFFLSNVVFSLHLNILPTSILIFFFSFLLIFQSIWTYVLEKPSFLQFIWSVALSSILFEISLVLWFWPTNPTVIALFLTSFFYITVGLSHAWFDKRLFRGVLWEYVWVVAIAFFVLILTTSWRG